MSRQSRGLDTTITYSGQWAPLPGQGGLAKLQRRARAPEAAAVCENLNKQTRNSCPARCHHSAHDHKEERQRYNQKYWETNGHKYIEQRKTSIDHKAKYLEMKEYHKEYHQKHYQQYGKDYYMKNKNIIQDKYEQYRKDYYMNNKTLIHQKYVNKYYNIFMHDNDNKNLTVYFN